MSQNINEIEEVSVRRFLQSFFYCLLFAVDQAVDTKIPIDSLKPIKPLLGLHYRQVSNKDIEKYTIKNLIKVSKW